MHSDATTLCQAVPRNPGVGAVYCLQPQAMSGHGCLHHEGTGTANVLWLRERALLAISSPAHKMEINTPYRLMHEKLLVLHTANKLHAVLDVILVASRSITGSSRDYRTCSGDDEVASCWRLSANGWG